MKPSILITVLILVAGALPAIHQRQRAAAIRSELGKLGKEAAAMGIDIRGGSPAIAARAKRQRVASGQRAKAITAAVLSLARGMDANATPTGHPDEGPGMIDENARLSIIADAAAKDPGLVFRIIDELDLSPEEKEQIAAGLSWFTTKGETGRWVEWVAENLPESGMARTVHTLVGEWTQQDYVAAGQWLAATPDGPARTAAVRSYAAAVAEYEPEIAAQWALTLPPGPSRDATLRAVYDNWPLADPQGAALFAIENNLD